MTSSETDPQGSRSKKRLAIVLLAAGLIAVCGILLAILLVLLWPALRLAPGTLQVNTDGCACALAMAVNIADDSQLGDQYPDVLCDDLKDQFRSTLTNYERIEEWLMTEAGLILGSRSIPLQITQIEFDRHIARTRANIQQRIPTLVMVVLPEFTHCIVIAEYQADTGFGYLDSLQELEGGRLPGEEDFYQEYNVRLEDAWLYTFELTRK